MSEIRFYHMERQNLDQVLPALLTKALQNGHRILVKTRDAGEAERLNNHLWTFDPDSFLPHGSEKDGAPAAQPIWLTPGNDNPNGADLLILTPGTESENLGDFKLICTLLDGRNPADVEAGRKSWSAYKEAGHDLTYWQQGAKGWEKKSG